MDQGDTHPHVEHAEIEQWWLAEDSDGLVGDASVAFVTILERYSRKGSMTHYIESYWRYTAKDMQTTYTCVGDPEQHRTGLNEEECVEEIICPRKGGSILVRS